MLLYFYIVDHTWSHLTALGQTSSILATLCQTSPHLARLRQTWSRSAVRIFIKYLENEADSTQIIYIFVSSYKNQSILNTSNLGGGTRPEVLQPLNGSAYE